jgi:integrase
MPPRRSKSVALPNGIRAEQLPDRVYWQPSGRGRWIIKPPHHNTTRTLCGPQSTVADIWAAYSAWTAVPPADTFRTLSQSFQRSPAWSDLAETTRRDYGMCHTAVCDALLKDGRRFGDLPLTAWTPGTVRKYVDRRGEHSRSRANHDLRYIKRVWSWAYERDHVGSNVPKGVSQLSTPPRQRYVEDGEYLAFLEFAVARYPYLIPICELAYLCRLRLAEVLDLRREDIHQEGLFTARRKGSKDAINAWSPRLRAAVQGALSLHGQIASLYIVPGPTRGRMNESTAQTAWQRTMIEWAAQGSPRFTMHDLKRKGVSDAKGDKLAASGHRSAAMLKIYDVLPIQATPTR